MSDRKQEVVALIIKLIGNIFPNPELPDGPREHWGELRFLYSQYLQICDEDARGDQRYRGIFRPEDL